MVAKNVLGADFYYSKIQALNVEGAKMANFKAHSQLISDPALFDLTIGEAMRINAAESDNNIFH